MAVKQLISDDKKRVTIEVESRFDFSLHQKFRDSYIECNEASTLFILNLARTEYMDSSALGMILLLKDHAEKNGGRVEIEAANESVNKILEIAQFHKLLTIR